MDEVDDQAWEMIMQCCPSNSEDQANLLRVREMLDGLEKDEDCRPPAIPLPLPEIQVLRSRPELNSERAETVLKKVQVSRMRILCIDSDLIHRFRLRFSKSPYLN